MTEDQRGSSHSKRARFVAFPIRCQTITGPTAVRAVRSAKSRLCDDDSIDAKCMIPDHGIFGTGQTDVIDVSG